MEPRPRRHYGSKTCVAVETTERREPITRAFIGAMSAPTTPNPDCTLSENDRRLEETIVGVRSTLHQAGIPDRARSSAQT